MEVDHRGCGALSNFEASLIRLSLRKWLSERLEGAYDRLQRLKNLKVFYCLKIWRRWAAPTFWSFFVHSWDIGEITGQYVIMMYWVIDRLIPRVVCWVARCEMRDWFLIKNKLILVHPWHKRGQRAIITLNLNKRVLVQHHRAPPLSFEPFNMWCICSFNNIGSKLLWSLTLGYRLSLFKHMTESSARFHLFQRVVFKHLGLQTGFFGNWHHFMLGGHVQHSLVARTSCCNFKGVHW